MTLYFLIPAAIFVLMFFVRMPIALGLMIAGVFYFLIKGQDMGLVAENILSNLYSQYVIIAVPLFVFTANVLNHGGITDRIFTWINSFIARYRGGLAHVTVIDSIVYSGMTGSAVAEAAGLGKMEITTMKKYGYDGGFSCAIASAASTIGPIIPPSIPMVLYAMLSGASIGALFLGGIIPGLLIGVALMVYIIYIANKRKYPKGRKFTMREFLVHTVKAFPALLTPVILLGGIYSGVMTPTEAGAVAAFYALLLSLFVYRVVGGKALYDLLVDTVRMTGILSMLVGSSYVFSYIVAQEQLPNIVGAWMLDITHNKYLLLLIINVVFLALGMFLDTSIITVVFIPIVLPLIKQLGIDPVHFGVTIVLNMMIGLSTPPYGVLLFITSAISKTPLRAVIREIWPMLGVMIVVLLLVTYIPGLVLWLPSTATH